MRKASFLMILILMISTSVDAQYKKASFLTRNGKFYGTKAGMNLYSDGVKAAPTLSLIFGRDKGGKHGMWNWWDLEYTTASKYNYSSTSVNSVNTKVDVSGKTNGMLSLRYNLGYYLADDDDDTKKGLPFFKVAAEVRLSGRGVKEQTVNPDGDFPRQIASADGANFGFDVGLGYTYRISETTTLFGIGGYRYIVNPRYDVETSFLLLPSHLFANIGIRFARKSDD